MSKQDWFVLFFSLAKLNGGWRERFRTGGRLWLARTNNEQDKQNVKQNPNSQNREDDPHPKPPEIKEEYRFKANLPELGRQGAQIFGG
ncbi:hypothetical protein ACFPFP_40235 [Bradyrhizobium sp. GCM10023182]|uniref:Uncharacterized protein n=1 Tax=Bradyrhizobium zhengyangense TaxID=2911009 RepID=A0ABS9M262_9BRAD|nr:hypothetical protein [Bradyrhizobium zhengyangense]MCG2673114.1 hypothetical protein [Bradyrhizobium zhengyangense]